MPRKNAAGRKRTLARKLDRLFSQWVRRAWSTADGYSDCYTCGIPVHYESLNCGHFLSRRHQATRWHCDNARPQCVSCNKFGKVYGPGESVIFRANLIAEGVDVEALEALARSVKQWSETELEVFVHAFETLLRELDKWQNT